MKKFNLLFACLLSLSLIGCKQSPTEEIPAETNEEIILHAWCWSFNTIKENLPDIAKAGFTIVQTSPANQCVVGEDGGLQLMGKGKWYYHYQPTDWVIGKYQLGSREDFIDMCNEAKKFGIRIIVDVLPNHTAIDRSQISARLDSAVGGRENLFHANGLNPIVDYNDRYQCTTGEMGGLPDVNTENPDFQYYYMQYVNDLLACGVRGFRYDTAKHIGLPSDPKDEKSPENDFWDVALGRKPIKDISLALPYDSLFVYGEVLQDKNVKEEEYGEYMKLTASNYGGLIRNVLHKHNFKADSISNWCHKVAPKDLVTWVESHDTYCNQNESACLSDTLIHLGWVFLVSRQYGTPLFYSRPAGSTRQNYWGDNLIGARGNDEFKCKEVVAANMFRHAMQGKAEQLIVSDNGAQVCVARSNAGLALINLAENAENIKIAVPLADGNYTDKVYGNKFTVADGTLTGEVQPLTSYIIY